VESHEQSDLIICWTTIASLYAHKDKRIGKLILLGAVSDLKHAVHYDFTDQQIHNFWKKCYITYNKPDSWVHHKRLKKSYYNEFFTLNIPKAIKKYHHPLLIIHGTEDHAIPLKEAKELHNIANKPKRLIFIKGADHRFSRKYHQLKVVWHIYRFIKHSSSLLL
jgi:esterase/lipase